ncbi:MAG: extracellular solute-binding protein [Proteobacteria bacterium]|nr:extracellular solute-binding protein [Pseudomonadota bacterium]
MKFFRCFLLYLLFLPLGQASTSIEFWHSFSGSLGVELNHLVDDFNQSQNRYQVKLVYKGEYTESFTSFVAAFRAKKAPALIQVFEAGTNSMLHPKGVIKPFYQIMIGQPFPIESVLSAVAQLYSQDGQLNAMPFNISIPVIFYNQDVLDSLKVKEFPKTWDEMENLAAQLKANGYSCAYTSSYPAWIHIESFSRIHGYALVNDKKTKAAFNNKAILSHLERLKRWQNKHYFEYGGRASEATVLFTSGHCPIFSQSSGSYQSLKKLASFKLGVALMPLDTSISANRYSNLPGGAAIWAVAGQNAEIYKGIAAFFSFLANKSTQASWHLKTGYIPLGLDGYYGDIDKQSYLLKLAQKDLNNKLNPYPASFPAQHQVRSIIDEAMEAIFAGIKTPINALNEAEIKANFKIKRFIQNNQI